MRNYLVMAPLLIFSSACADISSLVQRLELFHTQAGNRGITIPQAMYIFNETLSELDRINQALDPIAISANQAVQAMLILSADINNVCKQMNQLCDKQLNKISSKLTTKKASRIPVIERAVKKVQITIAKFALKKRAALPDVVDALETILTEMRVIEDGLRDLIACSNRAAVLTVTTVLSLGMISERMCDMVGTSDGDCAPLPYDL